MAPETLELTLKLVEKYGIPIPLSIFCLYLIFKYSSKTLQVVTKTLSLLRQIAVKLGVIEKEDS